MNASCANRPGSAASRLCAGLAGVVQYVPEAGQPEHEHRRALEGAAQCFEYRAQLSSNRSEKLLDERRAQALRQRLDQ